MRSRLALALLALAFSCGRCGDGSVLAQLTEVQGKGVERDFAKAIGRWKPADVGAQFALGDGVRVGDNAYAILQLNDGSQVRLVPGTQLRFSTQAQSADERGLDVQQGEAEVTASPEGLQLRTELGLAVLAGGSRVTLRRSGDKRVVFRVELGSAKLQATDGSQHPVARGQSVEVGIGMAILDRDPPPPPRAVAAVQAPAPAAEPVAVAVSAPVSASSAEPVPAAPPVVEPSDKPAGERADAIAAGPARVSLAAGAGESFTLHAARLPIGISFEVGERCPGDAVLVLDGKSRTRGRGRVAASIAGGSHDYELRCVDETGAIASTPAASGTVSAVRDGGSAQLPRRAPSSYVDADGRHYTVTYQNLLPKITFSWPSAPKSDQYAVKLDSNGKLTTYAAERPSYAFAAGALREGTHKLEFVAGSERSKRTELEIRFDNAAPKASLSAPRDGAFGPGRVEVTGVALPGFKVSLVGGELALDAQSRFTGVVEIGPERPDVVLRIESPRGVHYYVRRGR